MEPELHEKYLIKDSGSGLQDVYYSATCKSIPPEFQRIAERDLNETEERKIRGIQHLKEYMEKEKLPSVNDEILLSVLRHSKYNMQKSEAKLKSFAEKRRFMIEQLQLMGIDKIESILQDHAVGGLPFRDRHGRIISYTCPYRFNLRNYDARDVIRVGWAHQMFYLNYPITSITGFVHIAECKSPSISLLVSFLNAAKADFHLMASFPYRVASVEVLNENFIFRCFAKICSSIISTKIVGRFAFHGNDRNSLLKQYHPDILPDEFGGNLGPLNNDGYKQQLIDFMKELLQENP